MADLDDFDDDYEGGDDDASTEDTTESDAPDSSEELVDYGESAPETKEDDLVTNENEETEPDETKEHDEPNEDTDVSPEVREEINEKSNYSEEVNSHIRSVEELEIYQNAGLEETEVNGRTCLIRSDIDMEQTDKYGRTNAQRMEEGLAPYNKEGSKIELHHIGQKSDSPLAELTFQEHRSAQNYSILHDTTKESEIERPVFDTERQEHWKSRSSS